MEVKEPKVAIIQDYMHEMGGALRVVEAMHEIFPNSTVYTATYKKGVVEDDENWDVRQLNIQNFPLFSKLSKQFTPLYPILFESINLTEYDIIISSSSSWAKGVITTPNQLHVCYCHTPGRFLYHYSTESHKRNAWYYKPFVMFIDSLLRIWDFASAQRPDFFIANSKEVQKRISKFYRRASVVIYPPVNVSGRLVLNEKMSKFETGYYLTVSRLSKYKNIDLIIKAFNNTGFTLRVVGNGEELENLKKSAKGNIGFFENVPDSELPTFYQNCKGFIFATEDEDFGIVPVEALSYGKPVLTHNSGGPKEYVTNGVNGLFFNKLEERELTEKLIEFDKSIENKTFDSEKIKEDVQKFNKERFKEEFRNFVSEKWNAYAGATRG